MDTITKERNRQIRAVIAPEAIGKVTRFFDASTRQILRELLQNARRAGATLVEIEDDQRTMTITDNGTGIADPQTLLSFGASSWSEKTKASEDPAGMGFFSLAKRNASIESRPKNGAPPDGRRISRSWRVDLTTDNFIGTQPAVVREGHNAPRPHGTKVRFNASGRNERSEQFLVQDASEYYPGDPPRANTSSNPSTACRFQVPTWFGWTSCLAAIACTVRSPRNASSATRFLKSAVNRRRRFVVIPVPPQGPGIHLSRLSEKPRPPHDQVALLTWSCLGPTHDASGRTAPSSVPAGGFASRPSEVGKLSISASRTRLLSSSTRKKYASS